MKRSEFTEVMAYISAGISKPLAADALEVYYDLLGDLPKEALQVAAKRVVLEHRWPSFPSVAELREAAVASMQGQVTPLSSAEAWRLAWEQAACKIDLEIEGSQQFHLAKLPPLVREAVLAFGAPSLCARDGDRISVMRAQFVKIYEQLAAREQRQKLFPRQVKESIAVAGRLPEAVTKAIGAMP